MRLGRGKISEILRDLDRQAIEAAAEAIAEDIKNVKEFVKALLECCSIECIARASIRAGGGNG